MNVIYLRYQEIILILLTVLIQGKIVSAQDSSFVREKYYESLSVKISSSLLSGEIPLIVEYRPFKFLGNELMAGYVYENFNPFTSDNNFLGKTRCNGYKIKYGLKIYFDNDKNKIKTKNRWWYVSPQVYYKHMWINDRVYNSKSPFDKSNERYDKYFYNENRIVYGGQVIFGFTKSKKTRSFEFYLGLGFRIIHSNREITDRGSVDSDGIYTSYYMFGNSSLPMYKMKEHYLPTFQVGCYWSFPLPFVKTRKYLM